MVIQIHARLITTGREDIGIAIANVAHSQRCEVCQVVARRIWRSDKQLHAKKWCRISSSTAKFEGTERDPTALANKLAILARECDA